MTVKQLCLYAEIALLVWLLLLAAATAYRGLISGRAMEMLARPGGVQAEPARIQAVAVIIGVAGYYLNAGLMALASDKPALPPLPPEMLSLLTASLGLQLSGKLIEQGPPPPPPAKPSSPRRRPASRRRPPNP